MNFIEISNSKWSKLKLKSREGERNREGYEKERKKTEREGELDFCVLRSLLYAKR